MRRSRLTRTAHLSLGAISNFIATASGDNSVAETFVARLREQCEKLARLPGTLGRPRPDLGEDLRSFPFRGYVIVIRYGTDTLDIVDVLSERQDIDARFSDDES